MGCRWRYLLNNQGRLFHLPFFFLSQEIRGKERLQKSQDLLAEDQGDSSEDPDDFGELPSVSREQILQACTVVSGGIFALGFLARELARQSPEIVGSSPELVNALISFEPQWDQMDLIIALAVAGGVTGARKLLIVAWEDFATATNRSSQQVLSTLGPADVLYISF